MQVGLIGHLHMVQVTFKKYFDPCMCVCVCVCVCVCNCYKELGSLPMSHSRISFFFLP